MPPYESNCTALDIESSLQSCFLAQASKSLKSNVGKFAAKRGAIHRKTDAVKPFVHFDGVLAHALADHIKRHLVSR